MNGASAPARGGLATVGRGAADYHRRDHAERGYVDMSTSLSGARIVAVGGALAALLTLPLPWAAQEHETGLPDNIGTVDAVGPHWSGWGLSGAGWLNSHRPLPLLVVVLVALGTLALFALSWMAAERDEAGRLTVSALAVGVALAVAGFPLLNAIQDDSVDGRFVSAEFGFVLWRVAVLLTLAGLARARILQEQRTRALRDAV
ncbi:hypothetical protein AB0M20_22220 [Actinoplanes sp. NPDC051633]|uniref:hypothetical protein n=1 Tax=Actinoplanes sp. NPDC051633 TaxID=3155670 RepID=UPI00341B6042